MGSRISRRAALEAIAATALTACGGGSDWHPTVTTAPPPPKVTSPPPPPPPPVDPRAIPADAAVKWSDLATNAMLADTAVQPPGLSPMEQSRILAMAFLAGHDALNRVVRVYAPYVYVGDADYRCDATAAYEVAVATVLKTLLPAHASTFEQVLQASLTARSIYPYGDEVDLGMGCAEAILKLRANDGAADAQGPYVAGTEPGDYQPTPPVGVATFVNWGAVRPFVLTSGDQFRAPPPYDIRSSAYAADFEESRRLGAAVGSARTPEQSELATFWLESTPLSWQRILAARVDPNPAGDSLWDVARLFALLQAAQADAYIASLDSKYHYRRWRPITAIHAAASDGNADTTADPAWQPFDPVTPPVPEYPSAHATAATAGAVILSAADWHRGPIGYRSSTGSAARVYDSALAGENYSLIAREIGLSRIYVGYHFRQAVAEGWVQGDAVGRWVLQHALARV